MISAIMNWIPGWWYIGLVIVPLVLGVFMCNESNDDDALFKFVLGVAVGLVSWIMGSIGLVACYYIFSFLWMFTLGMFFDSIWDVPILVWIVIAVIAIVGAGAPAYEYIVVIFRIPK